MKDWSDEQKYNGLVWGDTLFLYFPRSTKSIFITEINHSISRRLYRLFITVIKIAAIIPDRVLQAAALLAPVLGTLFILKAHLLLLRQIGASKRKVSCQSRTTQRAELTGARYLNCIWRMSAHKVAGWLRVESGAPPWPICSTGPPLVWEPHSWGRQTLVPASAPDRESWESGGGEKGRSHI